MQLNDSVAKFIKNKNSF